MPAFFLMISVGFSSYCMGGIHCLLALQDLADKALCLLKDLTQAF